MKTPEKIFISSSEFKDNNEFTFFCHTEEYSDSTFDIEYINADKVKRYSDSLFKLFCDVCSTESQDGTPEMQYRIIKQKVKELEQYKKMWNELNRIVHNLPGMYQGVIYDMKKLENKYIKPERITEDD